MGIGKQGFGTAIGLAFVLLVLGGGLLAGPGTRAVAAQQATQNEPAADEPPTLGEQPPADEPPANGGAEPAEEDGEPQREEPVDPRLEAVAKAFPPPPGAKRLARDARLWVDPNRRRVIVDGFVAVRDGMLEMFACPAGTKEHESVVAVFSKSQYVHAALLAIGATPGTPVRFDPEYAPASGTVIKVWVLWRDEDGKEHSVPAQQWVCRTGTDEPLEYDWVFGGSDWWEDPESGQDYYMADSGDLICVSNFASATMDLPIESSKSNADLLYSACTDRIPERDTPVRLVLIPQQKAVGRGGSPPGAASAGERRGRANGAEAPASAESASSSEDEQAEGTP